jgi:hypothetical protein
MTQYMLSVHDDGADTMSQLTPEQQQEVFQTVDALNQRLMDQGIWVFGGGLEPPSIATTVKVQGGETLITDGPYAEIKEHLGGFWVVELPDLDAALQLAEEASRACLAAVEVRPFQAEPEA